LSAPLVLGANTPARPPRTADDAIGQDWKESRSPRQEHGQRLPVSDTSSRDVVAMMPPRERKRVLSRASPHTSCSPIAQPTPPAAPTRVSGRSETLALPRREESVLAGFQLTRTAPWTAAAARRPDDGCLHPSPSSSLAGRHKTALSGVEQQRVTNRRRPASPASVGAPASWSRCGQVRDARTARLTVSCTGAGTLRRVGGIG
jgi:hypothetical protein